MVLLQGREEHVERGAALPARPSGLGPRQQGTAHVTWRGGCEPQEEMAEWNAGRKGVEVNYEE